VLTQIADHAVVVVPSIWREPFGLTAIEAMASGRPVLATDSGALAELVDPSVGWSVAPTVEGLAQGLVAAFGASVEERRSKAAAARVRYETTFRPEGSISRLVEIYRAVARGDLDERATPLRRGISVKESS
jgi:glycosyltransferase involved in cell wall biosynthesis